MTDQRTDEWHAWRLQGIGSSDSAAIMGASPWQTAFGLWLEKTKRVGPPETNWAMERGTKMEPEARAHYELQCDVEMPAALTWNPEYPFVRASMDGLNRETRVGLEIKCPGEKDHAVALSGKVPDKYKWQLTHQFMASGCDFIDYFSYRDKKGVTIRVARDLEAEKILLAAETKFWGLVLADIPPELCGADIKKKPQELISIFDSLSTGRMPFLCAVDDLKKYYEARA